MFPENLVQACFQQIQTNYKLKPIPIPKSFGNLSNETTTTISSLFMTTIDDFNATNATGASKPTEMLVRELAYIDGINVLGKNRAWVLEIKLTYVVKIETSCFMELFIKFEIVVFKTYCLVSENIRMVGDSYGS